MAKWKVQKDKQRSTKPTYKTKDRVTRSPPKTGGELGCSGMVSSSCSTDGTRRVNLVIKPVISREWGKNDIRTLSANLRRVWRYQRSNQNPYIEEGQTTQWQKEKVQKDKQRSAKHTHKTKDRVTRTPLKTGDELMCSGRVSSLFICMNLWNRKKSMSLWWNFFHVSRQIQISFFILPHCKYIVFILQWHVCKMLLTLH